MTLRLLALVLVSCVLALAAPFSNIYFFGDSLSDTGNIRGLTEFAHSLDPNIPIFPDTPYYQGRLSSGPLWVEYFAQRLGHPDAAKRSGYPGMVSKEGNNFSVGGARATINGDSRIPFPTGFSLRLLPTRLVDLPIRTRSTLSALDRTISSIWLGLAIPVLRPLRIR